MGSYSKCAHTDWMWTGRVPSLPGVSPGCYAITGVVYRQSTDAGTASGICGTTMLCSAIQQVYCSDNLQKYPAARVKFSVWALKNEVGKNLY